jgi:hypothetical protein
MLEMVLSRRMPKRIEDAINDGEELPTPRSIEALPADPQIAAVNSRERLGEVWRTIGDAFSPYRPELHYMRGPDSKCRAKRQASYNGRLCPNTGRNNAPPQTIELGPTSQLGFMFKFRLVLKAIIA